MHPFFKRYLLLGILIAGGFSARQGNGILLENWLTQCQLSLIADSEQMECVPCDVKTPLQVNDIRFGLTAIEVEESEDEHPHNKRIPGKVGRRVAIYKALFIRNIYNPIKNKAFLAYDFPFLFSFGSVGIRCCVFRI